MASGSWVLTTGGAWNNNANWSAAFPNATTETATIATDIAADATITMGQAISVGSITFSDNGASGSAWTIAPGGAFALTLGTSTITTTTNATISASIAGSSTITKAGNATLTMAGGATNTGAWNVNAGTLAITTTAISSTTGTITVASGATLTSSVAVAKPITVNGTATISGNTTGVILVTGTATFDGSGTTTLPGTSNSLGTAVSANSLIYLKDTHVIATGVTASVIFGNATGNSTAVYQSGGSLNNNNTDSSNLASFGFVGSYAYYKGTGGTVGGSGNQGFYANPSTVGLPVVMEFDGATLNTGYPFGQAQFATGRKGPVSISFLQGTHTVSSLRVGSQSITSPDTYRTQISVEAGSSLTATGSSVASSNSSTALSALTARDSSTLTLTGYTTSNATPKTINLINGSTLGLGNGTVTATGVYLYGNSNKISAASGVTTAILATPIVSAAGSSGVSSISFTGGGSGYIGAPMVSLTGGGGTGATARAVVNLTTGAVTGIVVVTPGTGYTSAPAVAFSGGGTSAAAISGTAQIAANTTDATIQKTGTGIITLTGNNTNSGTYTISAGTLKIGNGGTDGTLGSSNASNAVIESGATLNFNRDLSTTYSGILSGAGNISKTVATGTAILTGDNSFSGGVTITAGALRASHSNALGTGLGVVSVASTGALELTGGITLLRGATITGTGVSSQGAIRNVSGNNSLDTVTLSGAAAILSEAGTLSLTSSATMTGTNTGLTLGGAGDIDVSQSIATGTGTLTKNGAGTVILRGLNSSYTGITTVSAGYLGFTGSITSGANSNFGNSSLAGNLLIADGAGIRYYGTGAATFSRPFTLQGAGGSTNYLESNGTGAVTFTAAAAPSFSTTNTKTLGLGGTGAAANTINYVVANNSGNAVGIIKAGAGKWVLGANNTATGAYAINGGTLTLQGTNSPASVAVSNSGTLLVLESATGASRTGSATVTVNSGAKIQTLKGTTQNGRHTYANLTFNGGTIRIGG